MERLATRPVTGARSAACVACQWWGRSRPQRKPTDACPDEPVAPCQGTSASATRPSRSRINPPSRAPRATSRRGGKRYYKHRSIDSGQPPLAMRAVLLLASCAAALRLPAGAGASLIPAEVGTVCKATCSVPPGSLYGYVSAGSPVNINVPGDDAGCSTDIAQAVCQGNEDIASGLCIWGEVPTTTCVSAASVQGPLCAATCDGVDPAALGQDGAPFGDVQTATIHLFLGGPNDLINGVCNQACDAANSQCMGVRRRDASLCL